VIQVKDFEAGVIHSGGGSHSVEDVMMHRAIDMIRQTALLELLPAASRSALKLLLVAENSKTPKCPALACA